MKVVLVRGQTGKPVANATVVSKSGKTTGITDKEGKVTLSFSSVGYHELKIVTADNIQNVTREIRYNGQELLIPIREISQTGINVSGERDKTVLSRYGFQQEDIKRIPGVAGDSLKAIQTVPGVVIGVPIGVLVFVFK